MIENKMALSQIGLEHGYATSMAQAIENYHPDTVAALIEQDSANLNKHCSHAGPFGFMDSGHVVSPLGFAAFHGNLDAVEQLLEAGASPNPRSKEIKYARFGTPLWAAFQSKAGKNPEKIQGIVTRLVQAGARDVNPCLKPEQQQVIDELIQNQ